ncbi:MAG TPA: 2-amino-4-hydroxy-6-hydroxymethyldihydropteridine diphosphokinase [Vicinamibacterales bacterium]|jgi:2-amino-4-hydroxy-6-hydroxymethyldihydropteridine diphosphokinase|nr:2-amino-4-hydroxy-6-hydroxymethyldihydropteridine diphosphokinase [Vicinamibacterales bacterium]
MRAVIAIGSNLGDRRAAVAFAAARLSTLLDAVTLSETVETEPEGEGLSDQPLYLNAVMVGETALGARALLDELTAIEAAFGRERSYKGAPRTLDLDLVLLGDQVVEEPDLQVPHPRFRERFFVLGPLAEIAPDLRDPITGLRVGELLKRLLRDSSR